MLKFKIILISNLVFFFYFMQVITSRVTFHESVLKSITINELCSVKSECVCFIFITYSINYTIYLHSNYEISHFYFWKTLISNLFFRDISQAKDFPNNHDLKELSSLLG